MTVKYLCDILLRDKSKNREVEMNYAQKVTKLKLGTALQINEFVYDSFRQ